MYALTFCYEGCHSNFPYAQTIAVSEDIDALREVMENCIKEDMMENEDDEWDDSCNFQIYQRKGDNQVSLQHISRTHLFTKYVIREVKVL